MSSTGESTPGFPKTPILGKCFHLSSPMGPAARPCAILTSDQLTKPHIPPPPPHTNYRETAATSGYASVRYRGIYMLHPNNPTAAFFMKGLRSGKGRHLLGTAASATAVAAFMSVLFRPRLEQKRRIRSPGCIDTLACSSSRPATQTSFYDQSHKKPPYRPHDVLDLPWHSSLAWHEVLVKRNMTIAVDNMKRRFALMSHWGMYRNRQKRVPRLKIACSIWRQDIPAEKHIPQSLAISPTETATFKSNWQASKTLAIKEGQRDVPEEFPAQNFQNLAYMQKFRPQRQI